MSTENSDLKKKISSKAITALISESASQAHKNSFPYKAYKMVFETPHLLTPRWINSINNWGEQIVSQMSHDTEDPPPIFNSKSLEIGPLTIIKESKTKKFSFLGISNHYEMVKDYMAIHKITQQKYWFRIYQYSGRAINPFPSRNQTIRLKNVHISNFEKNIYFIRTVREFEVLKRKQ